MSNNDLQTLHRKLKIEHPIPLKTGCELNNFFKLKFTLAWINYRYKFDLFW